MTMRLNLARFGDRGLHRTAPLTTPRFGLLVFLPILLARVLFIVTYPLNNMGGDASNYYTFLLQGKSSLVHAGGYPFLMGLPLHDLERFIAMFPRFFEYVVLVVQHSLDLAALVIFFLLITRVYNRYVAALTVLTCGLSAFVMSTASSTFPEFLQAGLLILAMAAAYDALVATSARRKRLGYCVSLVAFTWCYLVKFNALLLGAFYLVIFTVERSPFWRKAGYFALGLAVALVNYGVFVVFYHYPSTGAFALTYDQSWVLMTRVDGLLAPENGINTKRWLALNAALPSNYLALAGPDLFSNVNAFPPEVRANYRQQFLYLFRADEPTLDAFLNAHPLPESFAQNYSSLPISAYIGLAEADDLGKKVYLETVWAKRRQFTERVASGLVHDLLHPDDTPLVPLLSSMPAWQFAYQTQLPFRFVLLGTPRQDYWNVLYWNSRPIVWSPGVWVLSKWDAVRLPPLWIGGLIVAAFLGSVSMLITTRRPDAGLLIYICLVILVAWFVVASEMVLAFRNKEIRFIFPFICLLGSAAALYVLPAAVHSARRVRPLGARVIGRQAP